MDKTKKPNYLQNAFFLRILFCLILSPLAIYNYAEAKALDQTASAPKKILILGDSLSAAYGIPIESSWVTLLQAKLGKHNYEIVNASISGETTDGGLRALPSLLDEHSPDIVIIELGANDGLRGFPINTIKGNLNKLIELAKQKTEKILLLGMHIPPNYGNRYSQAFHGLYGSLADTHNTALLPFLLEDVAIHSHLMQEDRLHPTSEAQEIIKRNVYEALQELL